MARKKDRTRRSSRKYPRAPVYQIDPPEGFANRVSDVFDETLPVVRYRRYLISWETGYMTVCAWMEENLANRVLGAMSPQGIEQMRMPAITLPSPRLEGRTLRAIRSREKKARRRRRGRKK